MSDVIDVDELKRQIMLALGNGIDEETLPNYTDSFIEMEHAVVHVLADGLETYFRVTLTEVDKSEYFNFYDPSR